MAGSPGRNNPCPCGSGRKYKQCCLVDQDREAGARRRWRAVEGRVMPALLDYAADTWGDDFVDYAWDEFLSWPDDYVEFDDAPELHLTFEPWFVFHFIADPDDRDRPREWPDEPVGRHYIRHTPDVSADDWRFIETACASPFSFLAATAVAPGCALKLRDVFTGREFRVLEQSGSVPEAAGTLRFASVLTFDDAAILIGVGPYPIPPPWHNRLIDVRTHYRQDGAMMTRADLFEYDIELREHYLAILDAVLNPQMPRLANTDGEPLEPVTLDYELRCSLQSACDRLKTLADGRPEADLLKEAERDHAGNLRAVEIPWLRQEDPPRNGLDTTLLAVVKVMPGAMTAEVNSRGRASRLKDEIRERLGEDAVLRSETVHDMDRMAADRASAPMEPAFPEITPEIEAILRDVQAKQWESWLDEEIPALANATPRAAAQTLEGRERLEALLAEYAWRNERLPQAARVDIDHLRRRLGLALA